MTRREMYELAAQVNDQEVADLLLAKIAETVAEQDGIPLAEAEALVQDDIGYVAGYYPNKVRETVETLFRCEHPIFGSIKAHGAPSPMQALNLGRLAGRHGKFSKFVFPEGTCRYAQLDDDLTPIPTVQHKLQPYFYTTAATATSTGYFPHIEEEQDGLQ